KLHFSTLLTCAKKFTSSILLKGVTIVYLRDSLPDIGIREEPQPIRRAPCGSFHRPSISHLMRGMRMPDIAISFLVGCALGFGIGYAVRERISRRRRRAERTGH